MTLDDFENELNRLMQKSRGIPAQELLWAIEAEASALRRKARTPNPRGGAAEELTVMLHSCLSPITRNSVEVIVAEIERLIDEKMKGAS